MVRSALQKLMWVGRASTFLVGLAVMLAVVFGVASAALGANGGKFILGSLNNGATAITRLVGNVSGGPALQVVNPSTAADSSGLQVNVAQGKPPIEVNATAGKASNLNADKLDGKEASDFYAAGSKVADSEHADRAEIAFDAARLEGNDASAFQRRVSGECQEGTSIRAIGANGSSVICEPDDDGSTEQVSALREELGSNDGAPNEDTDPVSLSKIKDIPPSLVNRNADTLDGKDSSDFAGALRRTVVVSPLGTDTENGQALLDALAAISDASPTKKYLLYIEPGTYDLGNRSLQMKEHVSIEGAGERSTLITSSVSTNPQNDGFCNKGTVMGADDAELRFLTVHNTAARDCGVGIVNRGTSPHLVHMTVESTGAGLNVGMWNEGSPTRISRPTMTNVTVRGSRGDSRGEGVIEHVHAYSTIKHSRLIGESHSLWGNLEETEGTKVAFTQLEGPADGGRCFNNYDANFNPVGCS